MHTYIMHVFRVVEFLDCRQKSDELPHTTTVSLSIVEIGTSYNSTNSKRDLKEPVQINYMNVEVLYRYVHVSLRHCIVLFFSL